MRVSYNCQFWRTRSICERNTLVNYVWASARVFRTHYIHYVTIMIRDSPGEQRGVVAPMPGLKGSFNNYLQRVSAADVKGMGKYLKELKFSIIELVCASGEEATTFLRYPVLCSIKGFLFSSFNINTNLLFEPEDYI